jgi:predicted membrane channel-forming protein YqfA (hemolysin III family)
MTIKIRGAYIYIACISALVTIIPLLNLFALGWQKYFISSIGLYFFILGLFFDLFENQPAEKWYRVSSYLLLAIGLLFVMISGFIESIGIKWTFLVGGGLIFLIGLFLRIRENPKASGCWLANGIVAKTMMGGWIMLVLIFYQLAGNAPQELWTIISRLGFLDQLESFQEILMKFFSFRQ